MDRKRIEGIPREMDEAPCAALIHLFHTLQGQDVAAHAAWPGCGQGEGMQEDRQVTVGLADEHEIQDERTVLVGFQHEGVWRGFIFAHLFRARVGRRIPEIGVDAGAVEQAFPALRLPGDTNAAAQHVAQSATPGVAGKADRSGRNI
ncbi:MAG: hypothetical protein IE913_11780 [Halothiobacillus sp.]|nr:hypothetical protein [Halothiobacillus sp.]